MHSVSTPGAWDALSRRYLGVVYSFSLFGGRRFDVDAPPSQSNFSKSAMASCFTIVDTHEPKASQVLANRSGSATPSETRGQVAFCSEARCCVKSNRELVRPRATP